MIWIIFSLLLTSLLSIWLGYKRLIYLHRVNARNLILFLLALTAAYSLMLWLFKIELLSEAIAGAIISNTYASFSGFFLGAAIEQYQTRSTAGSILYINRTFISEYMPVFVALSLIVLGIYRTGLITEYPVTPIRMTSGVSLFVLGIYGYTIRLIPEFREAGIILIDKKISWDDFLGYSWYSEEVLEIEYLQDDTIHSFKTLVPSEDQQSVEKVLGAKIKEKMDKDEEETES